MASNQDNFFKVNGAKELSKELQELSRGMQNQILRSPMTKATGEIRKIAKRYVPIDLGNLKRHIKNKTFTAKRGAKGIVGRIGVFTGKAVLRGKARKAVPIAKYGAVIEHGTETAGKGKNTYIGARNYLSNALTSGEAQATNILLSEAQKKLDAFHAKRAKGGR